MKKLLLSTLLVLLSVLVINAQLSVNSTNVTCFGQCNGSAVVTGQVGYTYIWSNGANTATVNNLCAGTYVCSAYQSGVLVDSIEATIYQPMQLSIAATTITNASCGQANGSLTITTSGGNPPYAYEWNNGTTAPTANNLLAGTYFVTVFDQNQCIVTASGTITTTTILLQDSVNHPSACNACTGYSILNIIGAIYPITYAWSTGDTAPSPLLCMGNYVVSVTDANGCLDSLPVNIASVSGIHATGINTNVSCTHPVDTTVVNVTNGSHLLTFNWGDGTSDSAVAAPASHAYAHTGIYNIFVSDSAGCSYALLDTVINNGVTVGINLLTSPTCSQLNTGRLLAIGNSGTAPYTYAWNNHTASDTAANLAAGNYQVTVTDLNGCTASQSYTLVQLNYEPGYYVYAQAVQANCAANGYTVAGVSGGIPPYLYTWSTNPVQNTDTATALTTGVYFVTVTDSLGCSAIGGTSITSTCYNIITGTIFADNNGDCVQDSGEYSLFGTVTAQGIAGTFYGYTNISTGQYVIEIADTGTYTLNVELGYNTCGNAVLCNNINPTVTFTGYGDTSVNNNFGVVSASGFDLTLHPGWTSANPGFQKEYWVMPFNQSSLPFTGTATVVFHYDSNLVYQYSDAPLPTVNTTAHTLTWQVNNVPSPSYDWTNVRFQNFFTVPATLPVGYLLQSSFSITPTNGDCDSANNVLSFSETCSGSHDPNEKVVSPAGAITESDSVLTYTINFQNTGTAAANFVVVKDTLSSNLDPATVVNVATSYKYSSFDISGKGILTWTFNPYPLPDSLADATGSKGFIMFTVKKKANLPANSTISNTASVYFDYNTPVVTNTVTDTVATTVAVFEVKANSGIDVKAYPNPFSNVTNIVVSGINQKFGFELYDVTGRLQQSIASVNNNQFQIHRDGLAEGIYLYRIVVNSKQVAYGKLVAQ